MKFTNTASLITVTIALCLPLYFLGVKGHDSVNHLIISRLFAEQFLAGDFYPRWLYKAENGFGSPVMYYFPPLNYLIGIIFYQLHYMDHIFSLPKGYLALYSNAIAAMVISSIPMYKYLKLFVAEKIALLGAIFYLTAPYHLGIDLYTRFAYSETWAFAFIPLCLYFLQKNDPVKLAFSIAALVLSHLLTAVIFLPVILGLLILHKKRSLFLAMLIGIGLSGFYLIPAMSDLNLINPQIGVGIYAIDKNFITLNATFGIYLALAALLTAIPAYTVYQHRDKENFFWLAVLLGSLFMSLSISQLIWVLIPQLATLSFPWRFLTLSTLAATMLIKNLNSKVVIMLIFANIALAYPGIAAKSTQDPLPYLNTNTLTVDDFRTKWTSQNLVTKNGLKTAPELAYDDVKITYKPREIIINSNKAGLITIPQFYYPFWKSVVQTKPQPETGLMQLNLPSPGTYTLKLEYNNAEKAGLKTTIFSLLLLAANFLVIKRKTRLKNGTGRKDNY